MTGFRILDQFPVFLDRLGGPAAGGRLEFYEAGTSVPRDVYGDPDLTVNNGPTVLIGADGRAVDDIWGDGSYYVRLVAADDTLIADADDVSIPGGAGAVIPALQAGKFLTNDGAVMSWAAIILVPDPTGQGGKILGTDGSNITWQNPPSTPPPAVSDIHVTAIGMTASDGASKIQIITGTSTTPNAGGRDAAVAVLFPTPFKDKPFWVGITPRYGGTVSNYGNAPIPHVATLDANGFTAAFAGGERDDTNNGYNFNTGIPFDWVAVGLVNV